MKQINIQYYQFDTTTYILGSFNNKLCLLDSRKKEKRATLDNRLQKNLNAVYKEQNDEILEKTKQQLDEYFARQRKIFDIPLLMVGTDFQKKVWKQLLEIPYGEILTYKKLACKIKNSKAIRAVANANGANSIGIIIPCHRVIGTNGTLRGYAGGLELKKRLLDIENIG